MADDRNEEKPPKIGEYLKVALRQRWWFISSVFLCWAVAWVTSWVIKPIYESEALILVEQQKVPEQYVTPNVTVNLQDRLQSMTQQILSRTRLQSTINRFHLYEKHSSALFGQPADPIEQMRRDIAIELVKDP